MDSSTQAVDHFSDMNAHVESLVAHYGLSSDVARALGTLAAMVLDPSEGVLPLRPATNGLVATRLSSCAAALELPVVRSAGRIVDIGSGLGFPGLVLASMLPQASFTLVEQNEARCAFLGRAVDAMGLTNVEIVNGHAQRWTEESTGAELVTARALGRLRVMVRLSAPLLEMGGTAVIFGKAKREAAKEAEAEEVAGAVGLPAGHRARNDAGRYRHASSPRVREGGRHADAANAQGWSRKRAEGANADTCGRGRQGGVERCRTARAGRGSCPAARGRGSWSRQRGGARSCPIRGSEDGAKACGADSATRPGRGPTRTLRERARER